MGTVSPHALGATLGRREEERYPSSLYFSVSGALAEGAAFVYARSLLSRGGLIISWELGTHQRSLMRRQNLEGCPAHEMAWQTSDEGRLLGGRHKELGQEALQAGGRWGDGVGDGGLGEVGERRGSWEAPLE